MKIVPVDCPTISMKDAVRKYGQNIGLICALGGCGSSHGGSNDIQVVIVPAQPEYRKKFSYCVLIKSGDGETVLDRFNIR